MYATDEGTLRKLKGKKDIVNSSPRAQQTGETEWYILQRTCQLRETMHWPQGILHGQFNQTKRLQDVLVVANPIFKTLLQNYKIFLSQDMTIKQELEQYELTDAL
jgi:hypothetical protein